MPAHDERCRQCHEAEDLIHRHGRARSEADQPDQNWQAELAAAEADQAADAAVAQTSAIVVVRQPTKKEPLQ
jgi:hypothetical protein